MGGAPLHRRAFGLGLAAAGVAGAAFADGPPVKQTLFLALKPGSDAAFAKLTAAHAVEGHADSVTLNRVVAARSPGAPYQAVVEVNGLTAGAKLSPALRDMLASPPLTLRTRAFVIAPLDMARPRGAKRIGLVGRAPGLGKDAFDNDWREVHAPPVAAAQPELTGYVLNIAEPNEDFRTGWDGYAELWWPDWATCDRATAHRLKTRTDTGFFHNNLLLYVEEQSTL